MNIKKINILLVSTVLILLLIAILIGIKVLFSNSQDFEWGSVTDIISSFCNIVMALSAAYAAYNAKKWFNRKTTENAHIQAIKLKDDIEKCLWDISSNYWRISSKINTFKAKPTMEKADDAYDYAIEMDAKITTIDQLKIEIVKIETLGIIIINKEILLDSINLCLEFYSSACAIFRHHYECVSAEFSTPEDIYKDFITNLPNLKNKAAQQHNSLLNQDFNSIFKAMD